MKRPILAYFAALIAGIGFGLFLGLELDIRVASVDWILVSVLFIMVICGITVYIVKLYKWLPFFLIFFFAAIGLLRAAGEFSIKDAYVDELAATGQKAIFTGKVKDLAETCSGKRAVMIKLNEVQEINGFSYIPKQGISLMAYFDINEKIEIGQIVKISGKLYIPERASNPGGFDSFLYYRTQGIDYTVYAESMHTGGVNFAIKAVLYGFRQHLSSVFDDTLPAEESGIIKSIVLGDKSGLTDEIKDLYSIGGIYHLISISGLHIMILSEIMLKCLNKFIKIQYARILVVILIWVYCILTGAAVATVRASLMITVTLLGKLISRDSDSLTNPAFACMLLLVRRPLYLTNLGFLLTFTAVFGIALFRDIFIKVFYYIECLFHTPDRRSRKKSFLREAAAVFLSVSVFTFPVMYFFTCSIIPYSFFVNMLTVPLIELLLIAGIVAALIGLVFINAAIFASSIIFFILKFYKEVCVFFAELPFSEILVGSSGMLMLIIIYSVYLAFLYLLASKDKRQLKERSVLFALCCTILGITAVYNACPRFRVTMLDVGQSESIVISKGRFAFIIDGGGLMNQEGMNTGRRVLLPYLNHIGVTETVAFITHMDFDHAKGIIELADYGRLDNIFIQSTDENDLYNLLKNSAKKYKIPVDVFVKGDTINYRGIEIKCLYPEAVSGSLKGSLNDTSMVLMVTYADTRLLFTGDISEKIEELLLEEDIQADVLKLAHHGSRFSSSDRFLDAVDPMIAIVSAGKNNVYGFPSKTVTDRLDVREIPLYSTAEHGAIILNVNKGKLTVSSSR